MRLGTLLLTVIGASLFAQTTLAQIISQTPRPDVPEPEDAVIETVTPNVPLARTACLF